MVDNISINCTTGEKTERAFTPAEVTQRETDQVAYLAEQAKQTAAANALATLKAEAKANLIAGLPMTAEQAATLFL